MRLIYYDLYQFVKLAIYIHSFNQLSLSPLLTLQKLTACVVPNGLKAMHKLFVFLYSKLCFHLKVQLETLLEKFVIIYKAPLSEINLKDYVKDKMKMY